MTMESPETGGKVWHQGDPGVAGGPGRPTSGLWSLATQHLAKHLREGGAALFPTDTVPALAASPAAAQCLWPLKRRPMDKPLILMGADLDQLLAWLAVPWEGPWLDQARHCWPGLTT
ncbi:MAG: Sua5/YciO/YrdC/YwlC family protein, partial [Synechococcaceae cyanobacterium]